MSEYTREFRRLCDEMGLIKASSANWIISIINNDWASGDRKGLGRRVKHTGNMMSPEELRTLKIRSNSKLSREAWETLTTKGQAIPLKAHEETIGQTWRNIQVRINQARHQKLYDETGIISYGFVPNGPPKCGRVIKNFNR